MVISLEMFKKCISAIEIQMEKDDLLTELLVGDECSGWVSTAPLVTDALVNLLEESIDDKGEWISWWLWEKEEGKTDHVWVDFKGEKYRFNIKDTEDLYYLIIDDLENIKDKYPDEAPEEDLSVGENFGQFNEDTYKNFMNTLFGEGYTESEN